jgi:hypothetical protein
MIPNPVSVDLENLLRFFRQVYAHAMTLQQMMEHPDWEATEETYNRLRLENDRYAAEQFDLIFRALRDPIEFSAAIQAFLEIQSKDGKIQ